MTDFLDVNGWHIDVMVGNGKRGVERLGGRSRAASGLLRTTDRAQKRSFQCCTPPYSQEIAESVEGLMRGLGHHWSFDESLYSAVKGLGPDAGYLCTIGSTGTTKFSSNKLIASVTTNVVIASYILALGNKWTVMWWQQSGTSGTWHHYVMRSSGNNWIDGVSSGSSIASVVASSTGVQLKGVTVGGATGTTQCYDDLVALPYYLADAAIPSFAARTAAFSDLPRLFVSGRLDSESLVTNLEMEGNFEGSDFLPGSGSTLSEVRFTLDEV